LREKLSPSLLVNSIALLNTAFGSIKEDLVGAETRVGGKAVGSPRIVINVIVLSPIYDLVDKAAFRY